MDWTPFSHIVVNLARQIRPGEITFSGVNSAPAMLACLLAKRAYDFHFTYLNVAGGVEPVPGKIPHSSSDPALIAGSPAIFANEDFYDLCARGGLDLVFLGCAQVDGEGRTNVSVIGEWNRPKVRLPGGGGAAVMMPTAKRVVTWRTEHSTRTLVEKLDFVTSVGHATGSGSRARLGIPEVFVPAGFATQIYEPTFALKADGSGYTSTPGTTPSTSDRDTTVRTPPDRSRPSDGAICAFGTEYSAVTIGPAMFWKIALTTK